MLNRSSKRKNIHSFSFFILYYLLYTDEQLYRKIIENTTELTEELHLT